MSDPYTEPGRTVAEDGRIVYAWPPEGRFADLWRRFDGAFNDAEKHELAALLRRWIDENSTLVAYEDDDGVWHDVKPDWSMPERWASGSRPDEEGT